VGDGIDKSYVKADDETDSKSIDSSRSAEDEEDEEVCFFTISSHKIKFSLSLSLSLSLHTHSTHTYMLRLLLNVLHQLPDLI
jgi:hypothetical protein